MLATVVIYFVAVFGIHDLATCFTIETHSENFDKNSNNDIEGFLDSNIELRSMNGMDDEDSDLHRMQIIFPGTKWCGTGNVAGHDEDYGIFERSDKCCKEHDYCPDYIAAGETKHGLHNDAFYTRLQCSCDQIFYDCLKNVNSYISSEIGFTYFNAIGTQCYREDYPIVKCHQYSSYLKRRCRVYELDNSQPKTWQWFDLPIY